MENWNIINYRKQLERDEPKTDLFSDTLFAKIEKKKRGATSPESEIREHIAKLIYPEMDLKKAIKVVCGRTRGWTHQEMFDAYNAASKWKTNSLALMKKLIRIKNEEIKKQLSTN